MATVYPKPRDVNRMLCGVWQAAAKMPVRKRAQLFLHTQRGSEVIMGAPITDDMGLTLRKPSMRASEVGSCS